MDKWLFIPLLGLIGFLFFKKKQDASGHLYRYSRQPWIDHIISLLDDGCFYEACELCDSSIEKFPEIDEYKLLQIKILVGGGNLPRAAAKLSDYLNDELDPEYADLFEVYSVYLAALRDCSCDDRVLSHIRGEARKQASGLYQLWFFFLDFLRTGNDVDIMSNFSIYNKATKIEQAERCYLAGLILKRKDHELSRELLANTIRLAPKSYFAHQAGKKLKEPVSL